MLITCTNCQAKMRVSEKVQGKRVKCPKCATILNVPASDTGEAPTTSISASPPEPTPIVPVESASDPTPIATVEPGDTTSPDTGTEVTATPPPSMPGTPPPPVKAKTKRDSRFDDGDDDEQDDRPSKRKRRNRFDDDDDMDLRRDRHEQPSAVNPLAMTSMILGIVALLFGFGSCCCGPFALFALMFAVLAIIFGFMGKTPGSETYAWIGIGCGIGAIVIAIAAIAFVLLSIGLNGMMQFNNMNQPKRF